MSNKEEIDDLWKKSLLKPQEYSLSCSEDPLEQMIFKFWIGELPSLKELYSIVEDTNKIFVEEPNVLDLKPPITVCGDVHGQFNDLLEIFRIGGLPPMTKYLFLGDYVDRGDKGSEVLMLLCALKLKFKNHIYLIRGNHESANLTRFYGFRDEIILKYRTESVCKIFESLFNSLPIAATINNKIFCVHGGLSSHAQTIDEIQRINRFTDIPNKGAFCELVWNDPINEECEFAESYRNAGCGFGEIASEKFMKLNNITLIVRAHQPKMEGYEYCQNNKVLTIFSAPNYDPEFEPNKGAIMVVDENMGRSLIKFCSAPPPESKWDFLKNFVY